MANFTAADVKRLRDATGAGMMDCKKALDEADGDFDKAVEILRIKGAKGVGKRAERTAANGLVARSRRRPGRAQLRDRLRRQERRVPGAGRAGRRSRRRPAPADAAALLGRRPCPTARPCRRSIDALAAIIGEKLVLGRVAVFDGTTVVYLHRRASDLPPPVGVLVEYTGGDEAAARGAAMQIAAMRPQYLTRDEVPADVVENERRIAEATAREEGKPEAALPKIVEGRVNGFFKEVVLLEQPSVQRPEGSVKQLLDEAGRPR